MPQGTMMRKSYYESLKVAAVSSGATAFIARAGEAFLEVLKELLTAHGVTWQASAPLLRTLSVQTTSTVHVGPTGSSPFVGVPLSSVDISWGERWMPFPSVSSPFQAFGISKNSDSLGSSDIGRRGGPGGPWRASPRRAMPIRQLFVRRPFRRH